MHRNGRQLVVALVVLAVVAIVSVVGFVSCDWRGPREHDDPTVRGPVPTELQLASR